MSGPPEVVNGPVPDRIRRALSTATLAADDAPGSPDAVPPIGDTDDAEAM